MAGFRAAIDTSATVQILKWNPAPVEANVLEELKRRQEVAGVIIRDNIKRLINRGNPTGKNPSRPGEPPKKVSTMLHRSIVSRVEVVAKRVVTLAGSNMAYARRLELGFVGADSRGRIYDQAPRPYMRPGLTMSLPQIKAQTGLSFRVE